MTPPRLVLVETPFAGDLALHRDFAQACMLDSLRRGEYPFLSHLLYPQVLCEERPDERALGIKAGLAWGRRADATVAYTDLGISPGMKLGLERAERDQRPVYYRCLGGGWGSAQ